MNTELLERNRKIHGKSKTISSVTRFLRDNVYGMFRDTPRGRFKSISESLNAAKIEQDELTENSWRFHVTGIETGPKTIHAQLESPVYDKNRPTIIYHHGLLQTRSATMVDINAFFGADYIKKYNFITITAEHHTLPHETKIFQYLKTAIINRPKVLNDFRSFRDTITASVLSAEHLADMLVQQSNGVYIAGKSMGGIVTLQASEHSGNADGYISLVGQSDATQIFMEAPQYANKVAYRENLLQPNQTILNSFSTPKSCNKPRLLIFGSEDPYIDIDHSLDALGLSESPANNKVLILKHGHNDIIDGSEYIISAIDQFTGLQ